MCDFQRGLWNMSFVISIVFVERWEKSDQRNKKSCVFEHFTTKKKNKKKQQNKKKQKTNKQKKKQTKKKPR